MNRERARRRATLDQDRKTEPGCLASPQSGRPSHMWLCGDQRASGLKSTPLPMAISTPPSLRPHSDQIRSLAAVRCCVVHVQKAASLAPPISRPPCSVCVCVCVPEARRARLPPCCCCVCVSVCVWLLQCHAWGQPTHTGAPPRARAAGGGLFELARPDGRPRDPLKKKKHVADTVVRGCLCMSSMLLCQTLPRARGRDALSRGHARTLAEGATPTPGASAAGPSRCG